MKIAATICNLPVEMDRSVVAERFADMLAADNPRFNREKFMAAALWGIEERRHSLIPARHGCESAVSPRRGDVEAEARRDEPSAAAVGPD
jgi:hypothetical protein